MSTEREFIDGSTLFAQVEDPDLLLTLIMRRESEPSEAVLGIRDTPVVSRLVLHSNGYSELDDVPPWFL